jgi:hypothetical protein
MRRADLEIGYHNLAHIRLAPCRCVLANSLIRAVYEFLTPGATECQSAIRMPCQCPAAGLDSIHRPSAMSGLFTHVTRNESFDAVHAFPSPC